METSREPHRGHRSVLSVTRAIHAIVGWDLARACLRATCYVLSLRHVGASRAVGVLKARQMELQHTSLEARIHFSLTSSAKQIIYLILIDTTVVNIKRLDS